jgi:hypothetical protein
MSDLSISVSPSPARSIRIEDVQLFSIPLRVIRWATPDGFNEALAERFWAFYHRRIKHRVSFQAYNLWREFADVPEVQRLQAMFVEGMHAYFDEFLRVEVKADYDYEMHAWLRIDNPKQVMAPHTHSMTLIAATYYCQTDIAHRAETPTGYGDSVREGDFVVLNTAPMFPRQFTKDAKLTHAISPEPGTMVILPGRLMHWVNPVSEGDRRICVANNFDFKTRHSVGLPCTFGPTATP